MLRRLLVTSLAFTMALTPAARADSPQSEPAALSKLQQMVDNLGYTTQLASDKQSFVIQWNGDYDYRVHFDLSQDGSLGYAYVDIDTYKSDDLAKLNLVKLLEASDVGDFYFSMENGADGETLYANAIIPLNSLTPQNLRGTLQGMNDKLSASAQTWDTSQWKK